MNLALLGYGNMGRRHYNVLTELGCRPEIVVDPFVDPTEVPPESIHHKHEWLSWHPSPEAVIAATPVNEHILNCWAMAHSQAVLFEKPLATDASAALSIQWLGSHHNCLVFVAFVERYNPVVRKLREIITEGLLGVTWSVDFLRLGSMPASTVIRQQDGVIIDLLPHDIDLFSFLFGDRIAEVQAHSWPVSESEALCRVVAESQTGILVSMMASWIQGIKRRQIVMRGSKGIARADLAGRTLTVTTSAGYTTFDIPEVNALLEQDRDFCKVVETGDSQGLHLATAKDGVECCVVLDAIRESARANKAISL